MNSKISVVIPIYNVEDYLKRCIDSVLNQTYTNLEIILVDDGSTDSSGKIADNYLSLDDRIKVFHKPNGGLSDARNYGIEYATGEYITFIDSDDFVAPDFIEYLYRLLLDNNSDVSVCSHQFYHDNDKIEYDSNNSETVTLNSSEAIFKMLYRDRVLHTAWGKLFNINIFKNECDFISEISNNYEANPEWKKFYPIINNKIRFPVGVASEDYATIYIILKYIEKVTIGYSKKYYYYVRDTSIMRSKLSDWHFQIIDLMDVVEQVLKEDHKLEPALFEMKVSCYLQLLKRIVFDDYHSCPKYQDVIFSFLKKNKSNLLKKKLRTPTRIRFIVASNNKFLFYALCKIERLLGSNS